MTCSRAPAPELTVRAVLTGMLLGALLTPCNVYSGLKIGWAFNMSIAAGLLGFGIWRLLGQRWGILENNINQTAASAAASIISGGLVAPIPAWQLITGGTLPLPLLVFWVFVVSALGIVVAAGIRNQMLLREQLQFPAGVATAATMRQIHGDGPEAARGLRLLGGGGVVSALVKLIDGPAGSLPRLAVPGFSAGAPTAANLGFVLDPSLLMVGFGAIVGLRIGISLLLGAVLAWALLGPMAVDGGWAEAGAADPSAPWFGSLVEWLLWPGVTLMAVATLTSLMITLVRIARRRRREGGGNKLPPTLPPVVFLGAFALALLLAASAQTLIFGIGAWQAALAVLLSFVLAAVAARVAGETGIAPVGAVGKVTQLTYGAVAPGDATANLMAANVTGGAAGQAADLLQDLRTGMIIGASPSFQAIAQAFGVLTGSLVGSVVYLVLIPDPAAMLLTAEWPAPAVATWKAVAEVMAQGMAALPPAAVPAMAAAAVAGLLLALAESLLPERHARLVPSGAAMGLAFVIPAWNALSFFLGAVAAALVSRLAPEWADRYVTVLAAGLVAGESIAGVVMAAMQIAG